MADSNNNLNMGGNLFLLPLILFAKRHNIRAIKLEAVEKNPFAPQLSHWHSYKLTLVCGEEEADFFYSWCEPAESFQLDIVNELNVLGLGALISEVCATFEDWIEAVGAEDIREQKGLYNYQRGNARTLMELLGRDRYYDMLEKVSVILAQDIEHASHGSFKEMMDDMGDFGCVDMYCDGEPDPTLQKPRRPKKTKNKKPSDVERILHRIK